MYLYLTEEEAEAVKFALLSDIETIMLTESQGKVSKEIKAERRALTRVLKRLKTTTQHNITIRPTITDIESRNWKDLENRLKPKKSLLKRLKIRRK